MDRGAWSSLRRFVPRGVAGMVRSGQHHLRRAHWAYLDSLDFMRGTRDHLVPPARLRYRVQGRADAESFVAIGQGNVRDIEQTLSRAGLSIASFSTILDFGCGSGRVLRWMHERFPTPRYFGTDIDTEAIAWAQTHLTFASFETNGGQPPSRFEDSQFDFAYSISVFTHLDEHHYRQWMSEMHRLLKPGGYLLMTVHGPSNWQYLSDDEAQLVRDGGFVFKESEMWRRLCPAWYRDAFLSATYIRKSSEGRFELADFVLKGMVGHQDVALLRRCP